MIKIKIPNKLTQDQEMWMIKNIGTRKFYLHNAQGGPGWMARYDWTEAGSRQWTLTFENDKLATMYILRWGHEKA